MTAMLRFFGGPADGHEEYGECRSGRPLPYRIRTTLADYTIRHRNPANISVYGLHAVAGTAERPVWIYCEIARLTWADFREWKAGIKQKADEALPPCRTADGGAVPNGRL